MTLAPNTPITQENAALLPCPFCGSRAHIDNERGLWTVGCFKDACTQGGTWFHAETRDEATAAWNRRPALAKPAEGEVQPALTVWYGKMPESNGRENWTAIIGRKDAEGFDLHAEGFCFARSEYPGRVLYEADEMRWIIGERPDRPSILDYDADAHSGYVNPTPTPPSVDWSVVGPKLVEALEEIADLAAEESAMDNISKSDFERGVRAARLDAGRIARAALAATQPQSNGD